MTLAVLFRCCLVQYVFCHCVLMAIDNLGWVRGGRTIRPVCGLCIHTPKQVEQATTKIGQPTAIYHHYLHDELWNAHYSKLFSIHAIGKAC